MESLLFSCQRTICLGPALYGRDYLWHEGVYSPIFSNPRARGSRLTLLALALSKITQLVHRRFRSLLSPESNILYIFARKGSDSILGLRKNISNFASSSFPYLFTANGTIAIYFIFKAELQPHTLDKPGSNLCLSLLPNSITQWLNYKCYQILPVIVSEVFSVTLTFGRLSVDADFPIIPKYCVWWNSSYINIYLSFLMEVEVCLHLTSYWEEEVLWLSFRPLFYSFNFQPF